MPRRKPPDFDLIKSRALDQIEAVCARWLPNGKRSGREWQIGDRFGAEGQSLKVHLSGDKAGIWSDFSTGDKGGDLVSLVAYVDGISQGDAARELAAFLGLATDDEPKPATPAAPKPAPAPAPAPEAVWRPVLPIPEDAPPKPAAHRRHGKPDAWHVYRDAAGRLLGYVARFEKSATRKKKEFAWLVYAELAGRREWRWQGFDVPRPLYGLDDLAQRAGRLVLLVEGEKSADAARGLMPAWVVMTWPGGSKAVDKTDFGPLAGYDVVLWPDADQPGREAMDQAAKLATEAGAASVRVVELSVFASLAPGADEAGAAILTEHARELPEGWDAADAVAEGWTVDHFVQIVDRPDFYATPTEVAEPAAKPGKAKQKPKVPEAAEPASAGDSRFMVNDAGLYYVAADKDGELRQVRISDALHVPALARDEESAGWSPVLEFKDMDGHLRQEIIPRRQFLGDGTDGPKQLADLGLFIEPGRQSLDRLKAYIAGARPPKRARLVDATGWHGSAYLHPEGAIGDAEETLLYRGSKRALGVFTGKGKLSDWQANIAALAAGNPRLMFSLSVAFVGPLLKPCGGPSFACHWVGDSSEGKSGSLTAAGSVWGNPSGVVHSWRHTDNALEYTAAQHNDGLLILDELKEVDPKQAGAIAYMLSNSKGKGRAHHAGGLREALTWRIAMLSSGELGLADHLASAGQRSHAGQSVRFIELPSNGGAGLGMWNELHDYPDGRSFTDGLKAHAAKYHGIAGKSFVAALIERIADVPGVVKRLEERFFLDFVPADAGGQTKRVAACFALIATAGELAADWGIVPWQAQAAFNAAGGLFSEWLEGRPTAGNLEEAQIRAHVQRLMEKSWQSRFIDWHRVSEDNADLSRMAAVQEPLGFRKKDIPFSQGDPAYLFYVTRERFAEEFGTKGGFKPKRVAAVLKARGLLKCDADGTTLKEKLPNGDPRSYCIIGRKLWDDAPC